MVRLAFAVLLLAGCAATPEQLAASQARADTALARAIGDRVAGKPVDCIDANTASGPQVIDERTILYRQGRRVWRNDLPDSCPFLHGDPILIVELASGGRLCRNDRFRVLQRGSTIPSGMCRLGSFTPYARGA